MAIAGSLVTGIIESISNLDVEKEKLKSKKESEKNELFKTLLKKDNTEKIIVISSIVFFFIIVSLIIYFSYKRKSIN